MVLALCKMTVNTETYYFRGSKAIYENTDIATATGISLANPATEGDKLPHRTPDILGHGVAIKISVSHGSGTTVKTSSLLCATDKIASIDQNLIGKTYPGGNIITSARVKRDATFY